MDELIAQLRAVHPELVFLAGPRFYWSPRTKEIFYEPDGEIGSLLHEVGHALLGHQTFITDVDLLQKEIAAWEKAQELSSMFKVRLEQSNIDLCLDTYRDWLHKRSTCPECSSHGVQTTQRLYKCLNCNETWNVSSSVLCRAYRQRKAV